MPDFLDQLSEAVAARRDELARHVRPDAAPGEEALAAFVHEHWLPLPAPSDPGAWAAYAIDGSVSEVSLDNGSTVVIVQALCLGDNAYEDSAVAIEILPAATPRPTAARIADLMQQEKELYLAGETVGKVPPGSVVFLDGALYGRLPQLYDLPPEYLEQYASLPAGVLDNYLHLLHKAHDRDVLVVAVSKTSREPTHCKLWLRARDLDLDVPRDLTDSEMIHRWTDHAPGVSVPVVLGRRGFTGGSRNMLDRPEVNRSPAIVSCFVRLADFDDALRVDVPACQLGSPLALGDLEGDVFDDAPAALRRLVDVLRADYGGLEVYNALLYSVDREVRLKRGVVAEVYLPLIERQLGQPVRLDRSERRFV
jgi:hypothetical protein